MTKLNLKGVMTASHNHVIGVTVDMEVDGVKHRVFMSLEEIYDLKIDKA